MATTTTNLGLTKPAYTEAADIGVINGNFDLLDRAIAEDRKQIVRSGNVRNLLDNSNFQNPINQRGQNSYAGVYGIDRWRVCDAGAMVLASDGLTVQNETLFQYFDVGALNNALHTLAVMTTGGSLMLTVMNPHNQFDFAENGLGIGIDNGVHVIGLPPGQTYAWAALYEGEYTTETLPPYVPKGYAHELIECMRYYQAENRVQYLPTLGAGDYFKILNVPFFVPMRITPTIDVISTVESARTTAFPTGFEIRIENASAYESPAITAWTANADL